MRAKTWILPGAVLAGWLLAAAGRAQTVLPLEEAIRRAGEEVTFEAEIMGVADSPRVPATYVSFGGAYPRQKISVLFAGEYQGLLGHMPWLEIGQAVRVTGTVELDNKRPLIRVTHANQFVRAASRDRVPLDADGDGPAFRKRMQATLQALLAAGDYATLEQVSAQWRRGQERFLDGTRKISVFYNELGAGDLGWDAYFAKLAEWEQAFPDSITPRILHAEGMVDYAWDARGSGWARTVTDSGWKQFAERLAVARMELAALHARRNECPQWYATLQTIAMGQGWSREDYEALFEEAVRLEPDFVGFHIRKGTYLLPKWHGAEGEWAAFANSLLTRYPDGLGQELYAWLAWSAREDADRQMLEKQGRFFPDMGLRWEPMKAGFERIRARYPKSKWVLNGYAIFAGKAGDWETLDRLLRELGDDCDMDIWVTWDNVELARQWAGGHGRPGDYFCLFR